MSRSFRHQRKQPRESIYPNVRCSRGHADEPGYVVCGHIRAQGAPVAEVIPARFDELGQILCARGRHDSTDKQATLVCANCAREKGWLSPTERSDPGPAPDSTPSLE